MTSIAYANESIGRQVRQAIILRIGASSQSRPDSDILTAKLYPMTMGMMEWMWLATNHLMDRRQM